MSRLKKICIMRSWIKQFLSAAIAFSLLLPCLLGLASIPAETALASIRQMEEAPGQILYQSRHGLRDRSGNSWQVILFKRVKSGKVAQVNLRLVGFPGVAEFSHPQPLTITTSAGEVFTSEDVFAEQSPSPNVGQYDIKDVLLKLPTTGRVLLNLPMTGNNSTTLLLPLPVILEWQTVANS